MPTALFVHFVHGTGCGRYQFFGPGL